MTPAAPAKPPVKTTTFDITPSKPPGLSAGDKALLALAGLAVLGAAALVADAIAARDGYTPARGFDNLEQQRAAHEAQPAATPGLPTSADQPVRDRPSSTSSSTTCGLPLIAC